MAAIESRYARQALEVDRTDGLSFEFADWRFNLRTSNTEPLMRLNVEARGSEELMRQRTRELLRAAEVARRRRRRSLSDESMASAPKLSVVIPVYNEEQVLPTLFARLYPALDALGDPLRVRVRQRRQQGPLGGAAAPAISARARTRRGWCCFMRISASIPR